MFLQPSIRYQRAHALTLKNTPTLRVSVAQARLLAHWESPASKYKTLVPVDFARQLARALRAEKISQRLYRLLPPDSPITANSSFSFTCDASPEAINLNSRVELPGLRYMPSDPVRRRAARRAEAMVAISEYAWA